MCLQMVCRHTVLRKTVWQYNSVKGKLKTLAELASVMSCTRAPPWCCVVRSGPTQAASEASLTAPDDDDDDVAKCLPIS